MKTISDKFTRKSITITKEGLRSYTPSVGTKVVKKNWNSNFWLEFNSDKKWVYKYLDSTKNMNRAPGVDVRQYTEWDLLTPKGQTLTWEYVVDKFYEGINNQPAKDMLLEQLEALKIDTSIENFNKNTGEIILVKKGIHPSTIKGHITRNSKHIEFKCTYLDKEFIYKEPPEEPKEMWYLPALEELDKWEDIKFGGGYWIIGPNKFDYGVKMDAKTRAKVCQGNERLINFLVLTTIESPKQYKLIEGLHTYGQAKQILNVMNSIEPTVANPPTQTEPKKPTMKPLLAEYGVSRPCTEDMLDAINVWGKEYNFKPHEKVIIFAYFLTSLDFKERIERFNRLATKGKEPLNTELNQIVIDSFNLKWIALVKLQDMVTSVNTVKELEFAMRVLLYKENINHQVLTKHWVTTEWLSSFNKDGKFPKELTPINIRLEDLNVLTRAPYFTKYFPKGNKRKRVEVKYRESKDITRHLLEGLKEAVDSGESTYPTRHIDFVKEGL